MTRRAFALLLLLGVSGGLAPVRHVGAQPLARSVLPVQLQVQFMPPPFDSGGRWGLAYELFVTSFRDMDLTLSRLDVLPIDDPAHPLASLAGEDLVRCLRRPGKRVDLPGPAKIGGGEFAVACLWVMVDSSRALPGAVAHRATFLSVRGDGSRKEYVVEGAVTPIPPSHAWVIQAPLPPGRWLMANGPSMFGDHRCSLQAIDGRPCNSQRFASDWMLLGADGRLARGSRARNADWYGYGVAVRAVADAEVVAIGDRIPENVPLSPERAAPNQRETISGNYVVLHLAPRVFAFYAHLQPGSLRVAVGDHVSRGQVLGLIGNSGNSDAPHLHFQLTDAMDPMSSEGLPFALDAHALLDVLDAATWERMLERNDPWWPPAGQPAGLRRREMPTGEAVVEFRSATDDR